MPDGVGDLHVAFEQLKEKLFREGLFDPAHKKNIPRYPGRIALVTSSAGAAVRDMLRIQMCIRDRFGLILGMTGASAMLLLVSMVSAVSMVTP